MDKMTFGVEPSFLVTIGHSISYKTSNLLYWTSNIDPLLSGRGSFITLAHLTFDLNSCRAKKCTVVNGSRGVDGSCSYWKITYTGIYTLIWVILS